MLRVRVRVRVKSGNEWCFRRNVSELITLGVAPCNFSLKEGTL